MEVSQPSQQLQTQPPPPPDDTPTGVDILPPARRAPDSATFPVNTSGFSSSPEIGLLIAALATAQLAFEDIVRNQTASVASRREGARSYSYDYADLAAVLKVVRPELARQGIAIIQAPIARATSVLIVTLVAHSSGQWIRNDLALAVSSLDPQTVGSAITYGRRYALQGLLAVAPADDDDGAAGSKRPNGPERNGDRSHEIRTGQGPVPMPQRQGAAPPPAAPAPAARTPATAAATGLHTPSAAAPPAPVPDQPGITITALDKRAKADGKPYWVVAFTGVPNVGEVKACTFSTSIGEALERGKANGTVYDDVLTHSKNGYTYVDELLPRGAR